MTGIHITTGIIEISLWSITENGDSICSKVDERYGSHGL